MRAVILAAGDGGRLGHATSELPKPLIPVAGKPLIAYTLDAVVAGGVTHATVVTGYRGNQLHPGVEACAGDRLELSFVHNSRFEEGASLSLRAAREVVGGDQFLLLMADHLFSAPIVEALIGAAKPGGPNLVATDASAWAEDYIDEATRVRFRPGSREVTAIAKHLQPWDALDTGAFLLTPSAWEAVEASPEDCELSVIFGELARRGQLHGVDVSGAGWYDVDTAADLEAAGTLLAAGSRR